MGRLSADRSRREGLEQHHGRLHPRIGDEDLLVAAVDLTDEGPLSRERATAHLADADIINVVAVVAGEVVGFTYGHVLRRFVAVSLFIYSIDVAENHRQRGVAKAMIAALSDLGRGGRWTKCLC